MFVVAVVVVVRRLAVRVRVLVQGIVALCVIAIVRCPCVRVCAAFLRLPEVDASHETRPIVLSGASFCFAVNTSIVVVVVAAVANIPSNFDCSVCLSLTLCLSLSLCPSVCVCR